MIKLHKDQQGIIHHLALIAIAVLVIAGIGFSGYKVYNAKYGIKAKAETNVLWGNAGEFIPLNPVRILDTRSGLGAPAVAVGASKELVLTIAGKGGIPSTGVSAVALSLTVVDPGASGYLTAYPSGEARPTASVINFTAGQIIINSVTIKVGSDGSIRIFNGSPSTVHITADVSGYFTTQYGPNGLRYLNTNSTRVLDTRIGKGAPTARLAAGSEITLAVDLASIVGAITANSGIEAIEANLTAVIPAATGYLTMYPADVARPVVSSLNFPANSVIANASIVKLSSDKKVKIFNGSGGPIDVVLDVSAVFYDRARSNTYADGKFVPLTPYRAVDTRLGIGLPARKIYSQETASFDIANRGGVPAIARGVAANGTVTEPDVVGYINMMQADYRSTSSINFSAGQTIANMMSMGLGGGTRGSIYNGSAGSIHYLLDVYGYYAL